MLIDMYLKVEEEVVFCGGAVGKSGEVSTKSSIEDLLSKNLVQEYKQGYENKKMWMGDFLRKGSESLFVTVPPRKSFAARWRPCSRRSPQTSARYLPCTIQYNTFYNNFPKLTQRGKRFLPDLVVMGSVKAQWCFESWSKYITHWVSST